MVSKNNFQQHQQAVADRVPHYGIRKLSVGVASVLLSTTLYMGVTAHADTTVSTNPQPTTNQPANTASGTSTGDATTVLHSQPTADQPASVAANHSASENNVNAKPAPTALPKQPANATDAQPTADHSSRATNSPTPENDMNVKSAPTALPKQPANADTQSAATTSGVQPFVNLAVESDNNDLTPKKETVDSQWIIHYVNQADHKQELKDPTVITLQYTRTNTSQSDGTTKYGDWFYVPGSYKQTGTQITVNDSNNPVKQDNVDKDGENMDAFTITAMYPTIAGYTMHNNINGTRLHDYLRNNDRQADTMSKDFYAEYDVAKERSVAVKFVDDQSFDPGSSDGKTQVGQAITLTGRDGDTVDVKLTVPDKYQLADGQQLPTTYTFTKGSGDLKIHLVHKVVQREAAIDVQLMLTTNVHTGGDYAIGTATQARWKQLGYKVNDGGPSSSVGDWLAVNPLVKAGTLTGHVDYDLVDERVTSLGNDWTTLNLGGKTYQLPNGDEVVNGIMIDGEDTWGEPLKEFTLKQSQMLSQITHVDVDPDYVNRPWHGYLSVNATNNDSNGLIDEARSLGLQALVGDEPNALAKAIGDRAATAVEMSNKLIDLDLLREYDFDFSEQDGQLRAKAIVPVAGMYIPYVEKTATRTINVTTPDGKTTAVKQTATLAKQVDFGKDVHPAWTTGEWANYTVPTIPGYTVSQSQVAKETVTGTTEDQTVNITYTANPQMTTVVYQTEDGTPVHTTTVNGHTGQTVKVSNEVPAGWRIVNGKVPSEITFGPNGTSKTVVTIAHSHVTVTPDTPKTASDKLPDNPDKTYPTGVSETDLNKTITRTIKVTTPDGQTKTIAQTAKLTRTADVDEVTGEVKYSDWTTGEWNKYDVPSVPGYTPSQSNITKETVTDTTKDQAVNITYTANPQTTHVNYVDTQGKLVHTTTVNGQTNQTVDVPSEVPVGWKLVDSQTVPTTITFGPDGYADTSVKIEHRHVTVTPDKPQTNGTKLPDNSTQSFHGVEASDLNKTVTRTITVTTPDGQTNTIKQTAKLTRNATVDEVTGDVSYSDWSTGKWDAYKVPTVAGYTATQADVAATVVNEHTADQTVNISYAPNKQKTTIKYVDDKGEVVHTTTVNGVTNQTVKVPSEVPAGWTITKGEVPSELTFGADGHEPIEVTVAHKHVKVTSDHPQDNGTKLPDNPAKTFNGVEINDLSKTITRTIKVTTPDGQTKTVDQTAHLTRTADVDEVTGEVKYSDWTNGEWDKYDVPSVPGYTASQSNVAKETVTGTTKDQTVNVTYTPDAQKLNVKFVDDTTGQVLKTVAKTGVTNAVASYNTQSDIQSYEDQHYVLVSDSSHGASLVFDNDDNTDQAYEVHLKHGTHKIDEHHTITQTVHYIATDHAGVPDDHTVSVQFDRDGYNDEVTGDDHWNAWKQGGTQTFTEVPTPKKAGYTPDKPSVPETVIHPLDHNQTIDVTYTPDTQKVIVTFIDDTDNGKTLKTVTKTGPTNSNAGYTTGDDINTYKGQHYVLVSDQTNGQSIIFDTDTNADQRYEVHLKHGTHQINDHRTITETVHYNMTDGTTAPADHTAKIEFSRDGFNDEVTGTDHWNAWKQGSTQIFDAIPSPEVKGYTPDADQVPIVTVNPDSQSIERSVTYTPDAQKLDVTFIDDTTGETLKTVVKNGVTNADANYNTKSDIQNYESQHYVLVSDSSKGAELVFDNDDAVDQHYEVHLKHATHAIDEHHTINETVHYKMSDGTKAPDDYQAEALSFSRDGFNDEVTGIDHWNAWTPKAEQTFSKVISPLVAGYTPDIDQINTQTVKPTDHDLEFTVTYTPNVQIAHIKYIDDTDHKVLTQDDLNGRTGETSGYHTTDRITEFKGQHYVFVSDNYPATGMTFDNNDRFDQMYEVHFEHGTRTDEQDVQVPRTIKYVYQNGQQAQPDHNDALKFHETKVVDLVDGHTVSDDWTPAQDFETVMTPEIQGYTPDHASVSNTGIAHDHSAIVETVTYNPDAQKAVVKYIDDTTGEQLEAKDLAGVSDQSTGYTTKETIDGYINQHYVLVSDGTDGKTVVFDHNDDTDQAYEVHLKHGTEPANESRIKKITVHYQYADGLARSGKAADDKIATNLTFTRTGTHDLVTDKIAWNAWDHADQTFSAIDSPAIQGYTPDRTVVDNVKVNPDSHDLTDVTVTYNADSQKLSVDFIDDTTGKTLKTINKVGYSDESADYNTKSDVQDFISKYYDLVSDATNGANLVFDHDDNINQHYEVHLSHHTHQINEHHTVTETVHYQYADGLARSGKAADDFNATPLSFSRDGFNDEVTGIDHWNAWTPADHQTFAAVQSPVIEGYTPDQSEISVINVVPTSQSIEKTVTYSADQQKLTVNFIDDTTGETLKTVAKTGRSDEAVGYSTKSDLQSYLATHYDLVSDATKGADLVFDHDDGADQVYDVHLSHHLTPISDHQVVNETIHYVYADGLARIGKAADDYNAQALNFSRTGKHDDVTGTDAWDAWTPGNANFAAVQSPVIQGYTPDQSQIDVIPVNANSQDIVKTVTYSADQQKMIIDFIDDTDNGKVLKTVTKTGGSDEAVGYNTKADIQTFVDGHYKLDRDTSNGANLVFDHDDAVDQHYEVHLTHATKPISEAKSINETIRYQLADGTKAFDDYTAKVNFSRTGFNDLVTNIDHWNDWTPAVEQNFNAIQSPVKQGYTPDHAQIDAITVHPGDADTARTVIYSPDAQTVTIDYLDDVTGKTLQTKTITGVSDVDTGYTTAETINNYEGQHYKLVSDNTNGDQLVFDHDDVTDQHYEVHLTHTYKSVNDLATVNEVIHYQYADGTQAKPDHKAKALNFSRTGTQDLVDNSIAWNAWTPSQQVFASVNTPAVGGYTPDIETVAPVTVSHDTPDVERTVIYHADDQTILVHYIDDDTQSTLKTDSIIGKTSQKSGYKTGKTIDGYKQAGYDLVSDDTNGDELVFDNDSTKAQVYNVHLKHRHQAASDSDTVKQTVHYVYNDGSKAADDYTATPIEFTRTGNTDLVTGKTTWNAWTPTTGTFVAVPSPVIAGYTPSRATIDHIDVHAGDPDIDETVTYVPDAQRIVVNYIDSVTHQTLKTDTLDGRSDQSTNYNTQKNIDGYKNQHYTLVSDDTQGQNLVFDHDDQATQVYNVVLGHETETVHRAHTVSETIDYKYADGTEAAPTKTAEPKIFSQSGVHDLVTNTTDWNGQWTAPQTFNAVDSPQITGFTPDHASIDAVTVDHDSQDVHKLVVYTANKQAAKINYIDDVTGETLETDTAAGHFGEQISFGRDVNDQIKQFENQGYKLVSNNFNGQKYQADDSNNVFEVHLTHQHQAVSEPDTVTETVKYQYADGTQAAKDSTQSAEFTRTGDKDLVTGTIVWMPSTETHQFDAVDSPAIDGFTPDVQSVPAATVKFGDRDITKVATYTANDQNAGIKIIDDTTGDVLNTQTATGKFGQTIEFKTDPDTQVADLHGQDYELVSDNFSHQKYQSDNTKNQFEIHVRHQTAPVTRTSTVTETVHYRDRNGHQLVPDIHATKTFTETGVADKVTGKTTWTPTGTQTFDSVKVPTVTGYTPDRTKVPSADVRFGDHNIDETVIYTPDSETAQIKYIDDVTGNVLLTDNTSGDYGSTIEFDHNPSSQINQYESQGYKLVSNSYGDQMHQFSATPSDNQFEVHLTHQTKDVSRTKTVTRTINYADAQTGNKLRPSDQQTLTFTEHGTMDLVTGKTTWVTAPVQHFAKVAVPDIDDYTHQMQTVDSQTADFDSDDFEVTVPYTKVQTPNVPDIGTPTGMQTINGQRQVISTTDEPQHQPAQNNSQAQTLPQTGNSEQNGTALAGLGLIGMVGSLFGFKKKRD